MKKIVVIDGNSVINRAFYATPISLTDGEGKPTNAVFGFTNMLLKILDEIKPSHLAVAFDLKAPTFRHKMYDGYKATRKGMPDELACQMPVLKNLLKKMNITIIEESGFEADDIIGTVAKKFDVPTIIVTGDKDSLQLIDKTTEVWLTKKGISETEKMTEKTLMEKMNLNPSQIIDLKALMGDSSDNIPGVSGVGEKTALNLLNEYKTLDDVYKNIEELKGSLKEKLKNGKEQAYLSYELAKIKIDMDLSLSLDDLKFSFPFSVEVKECLNELRFFSLIKRMEFDEDDSNIKQKEKFAASEVIEIKSIEDFNRHFEKMTEAKEIGIIFDENITIATEKSKCYKLCIKEDLIGDGFKFDEAIEVLKPLFRLKNQEKVLFDIKSNYKMLLLCGCDIQLKYDISLMKYVVGQDAKQAKLEDVMENFGLENIEKSCALLILKEILLDELKKKDMENLYFEIELPLIYVLIEMEQNGFYVDRKILENLKEKVGNELKSLKKTIIELAGEEFNINSPKQLSNILFNKLHLGNDKNMKSLSTGVDVLEKLQNEHEIIKEILRYRKLAKLFGTYLEGMEKVIGEDNLVHTTFNQTLTSTGRLSSSEPNLQNIPVRTEEGREIRKFFKSRFDGGFIVAADYSQIELRLLAHMSNDEKLIEAYKNADDIHAITASHVFNVPLKNVTKEMRRSAKAVSFGIIYGISDFGLSEQLLVTKKIAKEYIDEYFKSYGKVKAYMESNIEFAKQNGYVLTLFNRRRSIPELKSPNYNVREFGKRIAMNMPLQGTSADIIKIAMVKVKLRMEKENLKSLLILQVHDELIVDTVKEEKDIVEKILKEEMENVVKLKVPLIVDVSAGNNWYDVK